MHALRTLLSPALVAFCLAVSLGGCKSGAGDTCVLDRHCRGGLVCCKSGNTSAGRGICQSECGTTTTTTDAGTGDGG